MSFASLRKALMFLVTAAIATTAAKAETPELPIRTGAKPYTSSHVPHVQVGVEPNPEISKELLRRVARMPGIEIRATVMSLPGALGFRVAKTVELTRTELGVRQREFGHMHPDGSLHTFLSPEFAAKAVNAGWAVHHPWSRKWPKWQGFVLIYTPRSKNELQVVLKLVRESYKFVTTRP